MFGFKKSGSSNKKGMLESIADGMFKLIGVGVLGSLLLTAPMMAYYGHAEIIGALESSFLKLMMIAGLISFVLMSLRWARALETAATKTAAYTLHMKKLDQTPPTPQIMVMPQLSESGRVVGQSSKRLNSSAFQIVDAKRSASVTTF